MIISNDAFVSFKLEDIHELSMLGSFLHLVCSVNQLCHINNKFLIIPRAGYSNKFRISEIPEILKTINDLKDFTNIEANLECLKRCQRINDFIFELKVAHFFKSIPDVKSISFYPKEYKNIGYAPDILVELISGEKLFCECKNTEKLFYGKDQDRVRIKLGRVYKKALSQLPHNKNKIIALNKLPISACDCLVDFIKFDYSSNAIILINFENNSARFFFRITDGVLASTLAKT